MRSFLKEHWLFYSLLASLVGAYACVGIRLFTNGPKNAVVVSEGRCFLMSDIGYTAGYVEGRSYRQGTVLVGRLRDGSYLNVGQFVASTFYHDGWQKAADSLGVRLEDCK
jgi:hypothetical protein